MCNIVDDFRGTISPVVPGGKTNQRLVTVHTLTLLAMLRLDTSPNWTRKSIEAALSVVSLLDHVHAEELSPINPMIGFLWSGAGQVLIDESSRLTAGPDLSSDGNENKIAEAINRLRYFMEQCGHDCPYIGVWLPCHTLPPRLRTTDALSHAKSAIQHKRLEARFQEIPSGSEQYRSIEETI